MIWIKSFLSGTLLLIVGTIVWTVAYLAFLGHVASKANPNFTAGISIIDQLYSPSYLAMYCVLFLMGVGLAYMYLKKH